MYKDSIHKNGKYHITKELIATKIESHSKSNNLYHTMYKQFKKTKTTNDNFLISKPQCTNVVKNWNINIEPIVLNQIYNNIKPNSNKVKYDDLITSIIYK